LVDEGIDMPAAGGVGGMGEQCRGSSKERRRQTHATTELPSP
jgi:hypothetical protein